MRRIILCTLFIISTSVFCGCTEKEVVQNEEIVEDKETKEDIHQEKKKVFFELPDDFVEDQSVEGMYRPIDKREDDFSCVYYREFPYDKRYEFLTEETIQTLMKEMYSSYYGINTEVEVIDFFRFQLNNHKAYKIETEFIVDEMTISLAEYMIIIDDSCTSISYVMKKGSGWETAFENSANTIYVEDD